MVSHHTTPYPSLSVSWLLLLQLHQHCVLYRWARSPWRQPQAHCTDGEHLPAWWGAVLPMNVVVCSGRSSGWDLITNIREVTSSVSGILNHRLILMRNKKKTLTQIKRNDSPNWKAQSFQIIKHSYVFVNFHLYT